MKPLAIAAILVGAFQVVVGVIVFSWSSLSLSIDYATVVSRYRELTSQGVVDPIEISKRLAPGEPVKEYCVVDYILGNDLTTRYESLAHVSCLNIVFGLMMLSLAVWQYIIIKRCRIQN